MGAESRPDRALFQVLDARRQSTRTQRHRQVLSLLLGKAAINNAGVTDGVFDCRNFPDFVVENDRQAISDVSGSERLEFAAALASKNKADRRLPIFVGTRLRGTKITTGHRGGARDQIPGLTAFGIA